MVVDDAFDLTRDELTAALAVEGIPTRNYYVPPVHEHETYRPLYPRYRDALPVTDDLCRRITSLPCYSLMTDDDATRICDAIERIHEHRGAVRRRLAEGGGVAGERGGLGD